MSKTAIANTALYAKVAEVIEFARASVVRTVNSEMVQAYWMIGNLIVEAEQKGERRATYGERIIEDLAVRLTERFGKGFNTTSLKRMRQFYLAYPKGAAVRHLSPEWPLTWTHYRLLIRVENTHARNFYETESIRNRWSARELERQANSLLFERLAKSRDKKGLMQLAIRGQEIQRPEDVIKDPMILEFLDLPESHRLIESKLEEALVGNLQAFLLELGRGFAFVARQQRLTLDGDHFYVDLVFYHTVLKCYVLLDLKVTKLTHADLGQMQLYVNYYDEEVRTEGDNPTIGLILCVDKNEAMVKYLLGKGNSRIFASRYKLHLPSEKELTDELRRELRKIPRD